MVQLKGIGFTALYAPAASFVILMALKLAFGSLRVSDEEEFDGLDVSEHSESAYSMTSGSSMGGSHAGHGAEGAAALASAHR